jgi:hypothetical protein
MGGDSWIDQIAAEAPKTRKVLGPVMAVSRREGGGCGQLLLSNPAPRRRRSLEPSGPRRGSLRARARRRYSRLARTRRERLVTSSARQGRNDDQPDRSI